MRHGIVEGRQNLALMREMEVVCFSTAIFLTRFAKPADRRPDLGSFENSTQLYERLRRDMGRCDITIIREKTFEQVAIDSRQAAGEGGLL